MLRTKAFVKVTKKGGVVKEVREHYLRDDIGCGVRGCRLCEAPAGRPDLILLDPLEGTQAPHGSLGARLLLPDTNIILHHLDVLETGSFQDVVLLQTVLDEVRNRSPSLHERVRRLLARSDKRFYVFSNEHHRDTYAGEPVAGESANDRNDRAIRKASAWYKKHISAQGGAIGEVSVVMLSNDVANRGLVDASEGFIATALCDYCSGLNTESAGLLDMLEKDDEEAFKGQSLIYPEEHMSSARMQELLASGKALKGTLQISAYSQFEGVVLTEGAGELGAIRVSGRAALNRAIHGDTVAVLLSEVNETPLAVEADELEGGLHAGLLAGDDEVVIEDASKEGQRSGRILGIISRRWKAYCGALDKTHLRTDSQQSVIFCPMDRRIPRIRLRTRQAGQLVSQRLLVAIDGWDRRSGLPHGHLVRQLGPLGDRTTETEAILLEHDVAHADWTPRVLSCLPEVGAEWKASEADMLGGKREDLRHLLVCSIDPPGCTDIDDALHAVALPNGNIQVGVHIADVTHFVPAGSAIDEEAASRGTTVYLVDRRIDMLPPLLGTNLCSLRSDVERLAFSCIWELTPEAEVVSTRFCKSLIRSHASLTYDMAQARLDAAAGNAGVENDPLTKSICMLNGLAKQLKAKRIAAGALSLASPEVRFKLDEETQNPVDVQLKEGKEANSLVEEFMLLANISVATRLHQDFPDTAILRRHPAPPPENFDALNRALAARNPEWTLDLSSSGALSASFDRAQDPQDPYLNKLVRIMATRCMLQAQYFPAGTLPYPSFWHYGLACPIYTHFTSPIRRYADVLVHRLLYAAIDPAQRGSSINWDKARGDSLCQNLNFRNRMAQQAQRSSIELFTQLYFKGKTLDTDGYVIKIMPAAVVLLLPQYGVEGLLPLPADKLAPGIAYDAANTCFVNEASGQNLLGLFHHVQIRVTTDTHEASQRDKICIRLVSPALIIDALPALQGEGDRASLSKRSKPSP